MNSHDISEKVAKAMEAPIDMVWPIVKSFLEATAEELDSGKDVHLSSLGNFRWVKHKPKSGISLTGRRFHVPAQWRLTWKKPRRFKGGRDG